MVFPLTVHFSVSSLATIKSTQFDRRMSLSFTCPCRNETAPRSYQSDVSKVFLHKLWPFWGSGHPSAQFLSFPVPPQDAMLTCPAYSLCHSSPQFPSEETLSVSFLRRIKSCIHPPKDCMPPVEQRIMELKLFMSAPLQESGGRFNQLALFPVFWLNFWGCLCALPLDSLTALPIGPSGM